jgi:hypothetical protein
MVVLVAVICFGTRGARGDILYGTYEGSWFNQRFSSTGDVDFIASRSGSDVTVIVDFGTNVFGSPDDLPPITLEGTVDGSGQISLSKTGDPMLGDVSAVITPEGILTATVQNVPSAFVLSGSVSGSIADGVIDLDYALVTNEPGDQPSTPGTMDALLIPEPGILSLLLLGGLAGMTRRHRTGA